MEVLKDKQFNSYDYISRYQSFPLFYHTKDNRYIYGTTSQLETRTGYSVHIVKQNDTYDSIALTYYNSPTLYWIICDFNHIQDPFQKPVPGTQLKIPILSNLNFKQD